jgi:hypothetical protein
MQHVTDLTILVDAILNLTITVITIRDRMRKHPRNVQAENEGEHVDGSVMRPKPSE